MSVAKQAIRGAVWTIGLGIGAKAVGAIGTIVITRFIAPEVYAEVIAAWIVTGMVNLLFRLGLDQYLIVKQNDGPDVPFHSTFYTFVFGVVAMVPLLFYGDALGPLMNAPNMGDYIPWCVIAVFLRRMITIPDRVLVRDLRFRPSAVSQALGELAYVASSLWLAWKGFGGFAIAYGNIVQSVVLLCVVVAAAGWRSWATPCRITWERTRDMMRFGLPLNFETALHGGSRTLDNLVFMAHFGRGPMGLYNIAYNLADIPATHVGEHISGVLLPSMAKIEPQHRPGVLVRSTALLAILVFPMAVGLGVVADPLIEVLLPDQWQGAAPLLAVLAVLSIFRPVSWAVASYMKVAERTLTMLVLEAIKVALLLAGIALFPSPVTACFAVGVAFGAHSLLMILVVARQDDVHPARFLPGFLGPAMACGVMAGAVLGVRYLLGHVGVDSAIVSLIAQIATGAIVYVPAALVCAPGTARDLLALLGKAYGRRRPPDGTDGHRET